MSKKIELEMECPRCKTNFKALLYRTIWVEDAANMELITSDRINVVDCPMCGLSEKQPFPFLATNTIKRIAVWYEPISDQHIDSDIELYRKHYGEDFFLSRPKRIRHWDEFKRCLIDLNSTPDASSNMEDLARLKQGMSSLYADVNQFRRRATPFSLVSLVRSWRARTRGKSIPIVHTRSQPEDVRGELSGKSSAATGNPITKLEQAISGWDREQARLALGIFSATMFNDPAPLASILGEGAKLETAVGRLTVGHLRILHSIMSEIVPDDDFGMSSEKIERVKVR